MPEINHELATALKLAKTRAMQFAFVTKSPSEGTLLVSKNKIQAKAIAEAKKELGGGQIIKGRCQGDADGELVFEIAKDPPVSLSKSLKTIIHRDAGLTLKVDARQAHDVSEEDEQDETDSNEAVAPALLKNGSTDSDSGQAPAMHVADKEQVHNRLAALAVQYKKLVAAGTADSEKLHTVFEAVKGFIEKHDFAHASQGLDTMEKLLGQGAVTYNTAFTNSNPVSPAALPAGAGNVGPGAGGVSDGPQNMAGPATKAKAQPPKVGPLTDVSAGKLIENLVYLSDPSFLRRIPPPAPANLQRSCGG